MGGLLILLLAIIFTGLVVTLFKMFYGKNISKETLPGELNIPGLVVIAILLGIITVMGLYIPEELRTLIDQAVEIVIGG